MTTASKPDPASSTSNASPVVAVAVALGLVLSATVAALALSSGSPAGAVGLVRFESCEAIEGWVDDVDGGDGWRGEFDTAEEVPTAGVDDAAMEGGAEAPDGSMSPDTGSGSTGGTNTVVEGVDEVDVIDRVSDDLLLVSTYGVLSLVDLGSMERVAVLEGIAPDARITHEDGVVFAAGSSPDGMGTLVQRIRVDGASLLLDGEWTTTGYLLDARRSGGRLHVVAVEQPFDGGIPFPEGPVACDQVWRPVAPATTPAATLVASFDEDGPLAPVAAAEIAGSAGNMLVTGSALYVATESWGTDGAVTTGVHRFALGSLEPTGSGAVPGSVAGRFAMNEDGDHLRVATHLGGSGGGLIEPMPVDDVRVGAADTDSTPAIEQVQAPDEDETTTTEPDTTTTTEPDTTTTTEPDTTTTTEPDTTTTSSTVPDTTTSSTSTTTSTVPAAPDALAEVFVLDVDGALDIVGRTGRFGRDYETIQGVRFLGDVAYVVTFRQTDPFWVVDLADPAAPRVVGELQIPGFSAYLHPAGDGRVVGFGPDGNGRASARLFDVSDPTAPVVLDEVSLGDESAITWDHHAFVSLGGTRFAVPVTDYPDTYVDDGDCPVTGGTDGTDGSLGSDASGGITEEEANLDEPPPDLRPCELVPIGGGAGGVVLDVSGGRLSVVDRPTVTGIDMAAERVVQAPDGTWLVLGYGRLVATDGTELPLGAG